MEIQFSPLRCVFLVVFLAAFALLGGFTSPAGHLGEEMLPSTVNRSWLTCVIMFVVGAGMTTIVDHWVGMMPPSNLRPIYMVGGVLLMVAATLWYRSMLGSWAAQMAG